MHCFVLFFFLLGYYSQYTTALQLHYLPPPLLVTCSNAQHHVYQRHDNELRISCFWDRKLDLKYSRNQRLASEIKGEDHGMQAPPYCQWFQDSILVQNTSHWSGQLVLSTDEDRGDARPPWAFTRVIMQCVSALCVVPSCSHNNLSIEVARQDVRLFILSPQNLPIREWEPVQLGWCARLKSSTWSYHFKSQGGSPAEFLIPSNQHSEPFAPTVFLNSELHHVCASYYNYHVTVCYPRRGFYTASLQIENGPQLTRSLDLYVEPALLHVFSTTSTLLSLPDRTLNFSWTLRPLSPRIMAYSLVDEQGLEEWSLSHNYNPFAIQSNFCAAPKSQNSRDKIVANIYFRTNDRISGELLGKMDFSNKTLIFKTGSRTIYLTLNPQKVQMGMYIFSHASGLYHSTQEIMTADDTREQSRFHYIFYQQQSLSYLIILEFIQLRWYRFSMHLYLNRRDNLFKSLGEKDMDIHIFSDHAPEESVVYIVWFIPLQHPQLQCEWAFNLQLFDSRKKHLLWNSTYTYRNHVKSAARFLPHSVLSFRPTLYTGFVAPVNCRKSGLAHAILKATVNTYASKVTEPTVACQKSYCHELTVTIHKPNPSNLIIGYKRGSAITLQATVKAECRTSPSLGVGWKIYSLTMASSIPDWANPLMLPNVINTDGVMFNIPRNVLSYGFYHVNVTMRVLLPEYAITFVESDSVILQILPSDLVAVIAGGLFRTVGVSDFWALNASASFDPDSAKPLEGLVFRWYCTQQELDYSIMKLSPDQKCQPHQMDLLWSYSTHSVQMVKPNVLQENMKYYFVLVVLKQDRMASSFQTVHVVPGSVPLLDVTCLENCEKSIKVSESFILSGRCLNCEKTEPVYLWTLLSANSKEINFDWASKTKTGRSNPYMHINSFALRYMVGKSYTLSLKVSTQGRHSAVYKYSFYVNPPPRTGKCIIYPKEGTAFFTKFTVQCTGFEVKNGPLTYKVMVYSDPTETTDTTYLQNTVLGTAVYIGYQRKTPPSFLPPGLPSKNYALVIYVQVYDADGIFSQVTLQATVYDPGRNRSSDEVLYELRNLVRRLNGPISVFLKTKDYFNMGLYIYMVASSLNNIEASPLIYDLKVDLREILLNLSVGIPLTGIQIINQIVSSTCQITQDVKEISRESQLLTLRILKNATEALKRHRLKDLKSKELEVLGNGIFIGLSNVLRASVGNHQNININGVQEAIHVTEILADLVLGRKVPGEHETNMEAKDWSLHLWKNEKRDVSRVFSMKKQCRNCFYPRLSQETHNELPADAVVSTVNYIFDKDPFPWLPNTSDIHTAVIGFKMVGAKSNGDVVGINPGVADVILVRKDQKSNPFNLTIGPDRELYKTTGGFNIEMKPTTQDTFIQILSEINVTFDVSIHLGLNVSHPPIVSYTAFSDKPPVPHEMHPTITDCAIQAPYILCLPHSLLRSAFKGSRRNTWNVSVVIKSDPIVRRQTTKIVRIVVFTADCLNLDSLQNQWKGGSCSLGPQSSWSKIHCICEAKESNTKTSRQLMDDSDIKFLSGRLVLYPNPLDINKVLLAEFDTNPVTLFTVFSIFAGYIFCATWAMMKDKADLKRKNKILVLPDNDPYQKVRYLVTIYTGSRLGSGTTADIFLELIGQNGVSDVHHMKHPQFPTFSRASIDTFLLTTKYDLGQILSLHVWHNTSGSSPNWYLSRVKIHNVQTKQSWLFLCRNWLGLGKADGKIERSFAARNLKSSLNKMDYFLINLARDLEESHIWLSIFSEVATGSFTRVQRVSCCLVIMLTTLLFNIMFFSGEEEKEVISVKQRYLKSIYIGFVSALFSIPVQLTITVLFKYSKDKPSVQNTSKNDPREDLPSLSETLMKEGTLPDEQTSHSKVQDVPFPEDNASNNNVPDEDSSSSSSDADQMAVHPELLFFFKTPRFSWFWRYVAWALVFLISGASAFLIILYGLTYGYTTSMEWFIASMTSFFESVFLLQTLKMGLISAMSTITLKYCENINWISTEQYQQMKLVQFSMDDKEMRWIHNEFIRVRRTKEYAPLIEDELIVLRKKVRAQHLAFVFVKDIICHLLFSSCVLSVAYSIEPTTTFYYNKAIYNKFSPGLSKVNKLEHIYMWMSNVFVPLIHNDYEPTYLSESWSKILGLPRMRQIRAKNTKKTCFTSHSFLNKYVISKSHCRHNYNTDSEDQSDYINSWTNPANQSATNHSSSFQGFTYQSDIYQWEYKSYGVFNAYGPGGYSFYFFPREQRPNTTLRLDDLQRNNWLDERTWAVIFELTTFNPDVNLYCSITIMFETTDMGVVNASLSVHSYKLSIFRYVTNSQKVVYGIIVYILVFYLADEFHMLRQERIGYLKTATNLNNFAIKTICIFFILLIALKYKLAFTLLEFHLLNPEEFVPFHVVSQVDQLYRMVTGVLAFLLVLKPYRYFRFLYKMRLAEKTMSAAFPGFIYLTMFAALLFSTYMSFGYLIFGEYEWSYNTLIHSLQTVVSYCFSGLKRTGIVTSDRWLGIFFRGSFMLVFICVFINLWRALLMSTYISMKQPVYEQHSDEAEAINFVVLKIQHIWRSITYQTSSESDTAVANTIIFGKPVITEKQQKGLRTKQLDGKKIDCLSI
ncbi:polycystin family receptor for egg jelly-like [Pogona vitticeps]